MKYISQVFYTLVGALMVLMAVTGIIQICVAVYTSNWLMQIAGCVLISMLVLIIRSGEK